MGASDLTEVWDGNDTETKAPQDPAFHVFNVKGGGWVIVSGDDCTVPILAYSEYGQFEKENIPSNMRAWIGLMRDTVFEIRRKGKDGGDSVRDKWSHPEGYETKAGSTKKLLETACWGQEYPYNSLLSQYVTKNGDGVDNLLTGCVATSLAELLRFNRWPEHGRGSLPSYTTDSKKYSVAGFSLEDHIYDWDNMPLSYDESSTDAQTAAVARLMLDCGVLVKTDYRTDADGGSGAYFEDIIPAMIEHFGYSKGAVIEARENYTDDSWLQMIKKDIDKDMPVLYCGFTDSYLQNGHQFICDGYDLSERRIHVNWGWNGVQNNAWFALALTTESGSFSKGQMAIFGLAPDKDGSSTYPNPVLSMETDPEGGMINGISVSSGGFAPGETLTLEAGVFFNSSFSIEYNGAVKAVLVDKNGRIKGDVSEAVEVTGLLARSGRSLEDVECTVGADVSLGDRIAFYYLLNDGTWTPVQYDKDDYGYTRELAYADACFIKAKQAYKAGDRFTFAIIPGNKGIESVVWTYDGARTDAASVTVTSGKHTVSATLSFKDGTSETITRVIDAQ